MNNKNMDALYQVVKAPFKKGYSHTGEAVLDRRHEKVINSIREYQTFLEVGPGNGKTALWFLEHDKKIELVDITEKHLQEFFRYINGKDEVKLHLLKTASDWKEIPDNSFDVVYALEVIEHVPRWKELLDQMLRVAIKKVVITTPVGKSFWDPGHVNFFSLEDFAYLDADIEEIITKELDKIIGSSCFFMEIHCE